MRKEPAGQKSHQMGLHECCSRLDSSMYQCASTFSLLASTFLVWWPDISFCEVRVISLVQASMHQALYDLAQCAAASPTCARFAFVRNVVLAHHCCFEHLQLLAHHVINFVVADES